MLFEFTIIDCTVYFIAKAFNEKGLPHMATAFFEAAVYWLNGQNPGPLRAYNECLQ